VFIANLVGCRNVGDAAIGNGVRDALLLNGRGNRENVCHLIRRLKAASGKC